MKKILMVAVAALAVTTQAQEAAKQKTSPEAVDAKIAEMEKKAKEAENKKLTRADIEQRPAVQKKTGGFVDVVAKGVSVLIIDARPTAGGAPDQFAKIFTNLSKTNVLVDKNPLKEGECAVKRAIDSRSERKAMFGIIVVEDEKISGLMTLPEERVAVVNAAKYKKGDDPIRREERIIKEIWRALGFVAGVGYAPYPNDVLQPVYSVSELDGLEYQVMQPMNFQKMYNNFKRFGVTRARHIPYRVAVMEGWAASPTNEYQKAVWDEVHAKPTAPIQIKPETKKVTK